MAKSKVRQLIRAYLLLIVLGWIGGHRWYLGYRRSANVMMWITLISIPLLVIGGLGLYGLYVVFFWMLFDLFALPLLARSSGTRDSSGNNEPEV